MSQSSQEPADGRISNTGTPSVVLQETTDGIWPPPPSEQTPQGVSLARDRYVPMKRIAVWIYALVATQCIVGVIADLLSAGNAAATGSTLVVILQFGSITIAFAAFILLMIWTYRITQNVLIFGTRQLSVTPTMAVVYHFLPLVNLYKPFRIYEEIAQASDPRITGVDRKSRRSARSIPAIYLWWLAYIVDGVIRSFMNYDGGAGASDRIACYIRTAATIVDAISIIFVVKIMGSRQDEKATQLGLEQ